MLLGRVHTLSLLDLENKVFQIVPAFLKVIKGKYRSARGEVCFNNYVSNAMCIQYFTLFLVLFETYYLVYCVDYFFL